ncbi:hypothetical protein [Thermoplasma volcanium GSS1]|uniref:Uncharacterized protein n=1 Tax=Thermoplasma volcanium (strain ATCC 51530 / DSM 4299 / JCM 9571 / NBRC 15438 / GSS1) TaxID=273116 RepID=Q97BI5_THEVO|nr:YeeE/YedE family protein [Thermoplasma volcanium]BAB59612.1 hypothetical protein [Thermoplasma volcanium GSS1]
MNENIGSINISSDAYKRDKSLFWKSVYALLILALALLIGGIIMQVLFHVTKAPLLLGLIVAFPLAIPLELWNFTDPDTLFRVMAFQDRFLMVCFGFAIGLGSIILYLVAIFTHPNFGIKDFFVPGIVIGGLIFGIGVGLAGYFPGTIWIALGQGRRDAIYASFGGLLGAFTWSIIFGNVKWFFWDTLNFGPITWASVAGISSKFGVFAVSLVFGIILLLVFLLLPRYPKSKVKDSCGYHMLGKSEKTITFDLVISEDFEKYPKANRYLTKLINESSKENARMTIPLGLAFTITAVAVIILHQIFGESTTFSWIGAQLSYLANPTWAASNAYFQLFGGLHMVNGVPVNHPFSEIGWEPFTDLSSFLGGLIAATLISKRYMAFKPQVPKIWSHSHNPKYRPIGAFLGAFMVLFGARMANGCASGHILSGNIQMAISSFVFMIFVLLGAWVTLRYFMHLKINSQGYTK